MAASGAHAMQPAPRFSSLDGLRGLAAIAVMLFHIDQDLMPGGHLAVDFFFCLSGFVIALNYRGRLRGPLGPGRFMLLRLARLYPMMFVGALLAVVLHGQSLTIFALVPDQGTRSLFPFNPPYWSLLAELAVNLLFALVLVRLGWRALLAVCLLAAAWLVWAVLGDPANRALGLMEFGAFHRTWVEGIPRTVFSFTLGLLLHEAWLHRQRLRPVQPAAVLVAAALIGVLLAGPQDRGWWDLVAVLVVLPLLTWAAIAAELPFARLNRLLGDLSYPLYCVHVPIVFALRDTPRLQLAAALLLVPGALLLDRIYDRPLRGWLTRRAAAL